MIQLTDSRSPRSKLGFCPMTNLPLDSFCCCCTLCFSENLLKDVLSRNVGLNEMMPEPCIYIIHVTARRIKAKRMPAPRYMKPLIN